LRKYRSEIKSIESIGGIKGVALRNILEYTYTIFFINKIPIIGGYNE
jgi:hypothetical protein